MQADLNFKRIIVLFSIETLNTKRISYVQQGL